MVSFGLKFVFAYVGLSIKETVLRLGLRDRILRAEAEIYLLELLLC